GCATEGSPVASRRWPHRRAREILHRVPARGGGRGAHRRTLIPAASRLPSVPPRPVSSLRCVHRILVATVRFPDAIDARIHGGGSPMRGGAVVGSPDRCHACVRWTTFPRERRRPPRPHGEAGSARARLRSGEHTSELQSLTPLVCRL